MTYCGIDMGVENMALSFIDENNQVVSYKGKIKEGDCYLIRYVIDEEPTRIEVKNKLNYFHGICCLLAIVPEFKNTVRTFVELQVGQHCTVILKVEGAIIGFLLGRYPFMDVVSFSSVARNNRAKKYIELNGKPNIQLYGAVKETKVNTMYMAGSLYTEFYKYVTQFCVKGCEYYIDKMDDICDTIVYAYLAKVGK